MTDSKVKTQSNNLVQATHGAPDSPLRIGEVEIPCYVLEDERRVLVQRAMIPALGMARGGSGTGGGDRLAKFVAQKTLTPFVSKHLKAVTASPIKFLTPAGSIAYGYEATVLADICDAVLSARSEGQISQQQEHIAERCEVLVRGFAKVGIIALVDEATGYQKDRDRRALENILSEFISPELMPWTRRFPDEYYDQIYRLRGISMNEEQSSKRPGYIGKLTNDIVYARLAPAVLEELKRVTPRYESGRRKHKFHQRLTENVGHPKLQEHLSNVITLMRAATNYKTFHRLLNRSLPVFTQQLALPLGAYTECDEEGLGSK